MTAMASERGESGGHAAGPWSAAQYVAFEAERTRPVRDLLAAVPSRDVRAAVDIGCGPGNSTEALVARFPQAAVSGIDSSADMIAAARKRLPQLHFELTDLARWIAADATSGAPGPIDLILANAVLHWVPDHAALFPALIAKLAPRGTLAVQLPDNLDEPAQRSMREVAEAGPWSRKLAGAAAMRVPIASAERYYTLLRPSCAAVDIWRTTYYHVLPDGERAIVEWFKGSGLRPFLAPLEESEREAYLARYTTAVKSAYPSLPDGTVLLPFPRLFIVATRREPVPSPSQRGSRAILRQAPSPP
jgi:trans-aconitate 2-methyltransferase